MHRLIVEVGWPGLIVSAALVVASIPSLVKYYRFERQLSRRVRRYEERMEAARVARIKFPATSVHSLPAGADRNPGQSDGYKPAPPARASEVGTATSRGPSTVGAAAQATAPPGCTCGNRGICLHCWFAGQDEFSQKMTLAALEATERSLARRVAS